MRVSRSAAKVGKFVVLLHGDGRIVCIGATTWILMPPVAQERLRLARAKPPPVPGLRYHIINTIAYLVRAAR